MPLNNFPSALLGENLLPSFAPSNRPATESAILFLNENPSLEEALNRPFLVPAIVGLPIRRSGESDLRRISLRTERFPAVLENFRGLCMLEAEDVRFNKSIPLRFSGDFDPLRFSADLKPLLFKLWSVSFAKLLFKTFGR